MKRYFPTCLLILLILPFSNGHGQNNPKCRDFISYNSLGFLPGELYRRDLSSQQTGKIELIFNYSLDQYPRSNPYNEFFRIRLDLSGYNYKKSIEMFSLLLMSSLSTKSKFFKMRFPYLSGYIMYDNGLEYPSGGFGIFRNYSSRKMFQDDKIELMANIFASINPLNWHEKRIILAPGIILFPQMLIRYRNMHINLELFSSYSYGIKNSKKYYRIYPRIQIGYSLKCKVRNVGDD